MYKTSYDKGECQTGIIHIGYGAFHRAHQAVYIDDYMEHLTDTPLKFISSWGEYVRVWL